jgi:hypothetical protein
MSALSTDEWSTLRPGLLSREKNCPLNRRPDGTQSPSGRTEERIIFFFCRDSNSGPCISYPTRPASCNVRPYVEESNPACIMDITRYRRGAFVCMLPGETVRITYSECVFVTLGIQHAKRMHGIILSFVTCQAVQYFSTLSHKRHDFREKLSLNLKCVLWFSHSNNNSAKYYH